MTDISSRSLARTSCIGVLLVNCALSVVVAQRNLTRLVNPFVGTAKNGHTYPGATVPFGMVQLSPDTRTEGWDACSGYHYSDSSILGFSHLHLSGTGVADYGDILVMPTVGPLSLAQGDPVRGVRGYWSRFRHKEESASPGYYRVRLDDYDIEVELSATKRIGVHKYTFPKSDSANIVIDLKHGLGLDKVVKSKLQIVGEDEIAGFRRSEGWAKDRSSISLRNSRNHSCEGGLVVSQHQGGSRKPGGRGPRLGFRKREIRGGTGLERRVEPYLDRWGIGSTAPHVLYSTVSYDAHAEYIQ